MSAMNTASPLIPSPPGLTAGIFALMLTYIKTNIKLHYRSCSSKQCIVSKKTICYKGGRLSASPIKLATCIQFKLTTVKFQGIWESLVGFQDLLCKSSQAHNCHLQNFNLFFDVLLLNIIARLITNKWTFLLWLFS